MILGEAIETTGDRICTRYGLLGTGGMGTSIPHLFLPVVKDCSHEMKGTMKGKEDEGSLTCRKLLLRIPNCALYLNICSCIVVISCSEDIVTVSSPGEAYGELNRTKAEEWMSGRSVCVGCLASARRITIDDYGPGICNKCRLPYAFQPSIESRLAQILCSLTLKPTSNTRPLRDKA